MPETLTLFGLSVMGLLFILIVSAIREAYEDYVRLGALIYASRCYLPYMVLTKVCFNAGTIGGRYIGEYEALLNDRRRKWSHHRYP